MAIDMTLMARARSTGESVFRVYQWARPTLSLGRNQSARGRYAEDLLAARGVDVVRRPTGGRAILHWRELTYSVTAPAAGLGPLHEAYAVINRVLLEALHSLGADAVVAQATAARPPDSTPCFSEPSAGEIVIRARGGTGKVVGSAQYREDGVLLQHGSILLHDDQDLIAALAREDAVSPSRAASLSGALGREVPAAEIESALIDAVRSSIDRQAGDLDFEELRAGAEEKEHFFRDPLWTWRR
jgi:lipoyl(octanoyl) transferase